MNLKQLFDESIKKIEALRSYRCLMELYSWKNGKNKARQLYLYRRPGDIRIEQLGPYLKGVVVIVYSNGRVRARGGGIFSFVKVDVYRDAEVLKGITGDSAVESDWLSIFRRTKSMESSLIKYKLRPTKHDSQRGYELISEVKDQPFDSVRFVIRKDGPILLIERFRGSELWTRVLWKNIELNPTVSDKDFEL
jgi:hypothetical protein